MNSLQKQLLVFILLLVVGGILVAPVSAATTQVHVVKYASDGTTILAEQTLTYQQMRDMLPLMGDGVTHYYAQGPVFIDDDDEATEQALRWNAAEDTNVLEKDMGAAMGTNLKDLCDLVGGMSPGDILRVKASDGMTKDFAYENVYGYSAHEGPIVLTWYTDFNTEDAIPGIYPDTGYSDGMRLVWFADETANPWGIHAFGNWDWHEAAAPEYWYYYVQGGENYPTTTGLSVKVVSELKILSTTGPAAPVAAFTSDKQSGTAPLTVQFTDESTGSPTAWAWDFDNDGTVDDTTQNPSHIYDTAGTYTVKLTVTNGAGSDDEVKTGYIMVSPPAVAPVAAFTSDVQSGTAPLTVQFTDVSTGTAPLTYAWDFDNDGTVDSTDQSPGHVYDTAGTYTVKLTVTNAVGSDDEVKTDYISVQSGGETTSVIIPSDGDTEIYADSPSATGDYLAPNMRVQTRIGIDQRIAIHCDLSSIPSGATITSATLHLYLQVVKNPGQNDIHRIIGGPWNSHTLKWNTLPAFALVPTDSQSTGMKREVPIVWDVTPDVQAYVSGEPMFGWVIKYPVESADPYNYARYATLENTTPNFRPYLEVTYTLPQPPAAAFTADPTSGYEPLTVQFSDASTGSPTTWVWDFGDGSTSTEQSPSHTYNTAGTYTVSLTATNDAGSDTETKTDLIEVRPMLVWGPYLTGTTTTGTVINTKTGLPNAVTVDYATDAYYTANTAYGQSATDGTTDTLHHVALTGLEPDTLYHYRVTYGEQQTADLHFRTFPASGPITFVMYSDTQDQLPTFSQLERHKLVADRIAEEPDVAFVLNAGDHVNDHANHADWDRYFAAGSAMMASVPVYPAQGNHDDNDPSYFANYGIPAYYSFDCGDAHIAVLDSNSWADLAAEGTWLAADLQATEKPFRFVSFHQPPYSSDSKHFGGWENIRTEWEDEFIANDVLAVFNGHVHAYERFLASDVNYFVSGTGGGPAYNLADPRAAGSQNSLEYALGYIRVTIDPDAGTATAEVIRVAEVSSDLKSITTVYQPDTIFETVVLDPNAPPVLDSISAPMEPVLVNSEITATAFFRDAFDTHTAVFDWGDGSTSTGVVDEQTGTETSGSVTGTHTYTMQGMYPVTLTLTDQWGESASIQYEYIVVYNPHIGQASGSGTIEVGADDIPWSEEVVGKASFSLSAQYNKGVPSGNAKLGIGKSQFTAALFDYIVITDKTAYIHGFGNIDKSAPDYEFLLVAKDDGNKSDTYRLQIWDLDGDMVFDNAPGAGEMLNPDVTSITGGSIVIR
jgi:PKD repeat protein